MTEPRIAPKGALLLACALATAGAWAQPAVPSASAASAAERAQKETDRTMYWIRVLASKPAPAKPAAAVPATVATTAPAPRPAPPVAAAAPPREKVKAATPPPTAVAEAPEAAPAPLGRPVPATQAPAVDVSEPVPSSVNGIDTGVAPPAAAPASLPDVAPPPEEPDPGLIQIAMAQPDFPTSVVRKVHKGNVEVRFEVEPGGRVVEATVVETSNSRLNDAAVEAVKQWRFKPGPRYHTAAVNLKFDIDAE